MVDNDIGTPKEDEVNSSREDQLILSKAEGLDNVLMRPIMTLLMGKIL